jgi:hypothetical protein
MGLLYGHTGRLTAQNAVGFRPGKFAAAAQKEFMTFFYLYHLISYTIWLWFSHMAIAAWP